MLTGAQIGLLFLFLSLLFGCLSLRDYRKNRGGRSPGRRAWNRVAIIFAIVGIWLLLTNTTGFKL